MTLIYRPLIIALCAGLIWGAQTTTAQAQSSRFFESVQDMPLKEGLVELTDQALLFDKPQGRIIDVLAQIEDGSDTDVLAYYHQSLPQLGWKYQSKKGRALTFTRDSEILNVSIENFEGERFLRLMIEPQ